MRMLLPSRERTTRYRGGGEWFVGATQDVGADYVFWVVMGYGYPAWKNGYDEDVLWIDTCAD